MDKIEKQQSQIDKLFEQQLAPLPVLNRLSEYAKRGLEAPESLSLREIQEVCYALCVQYSQIGIA